MFKPISGFGFDVLLGDSMHDSSLFGVCGGGFEVLLKGTQ